MKDIETFLKKMGYEVTQMMQSERFFYGHVSHKNTPYFFKVSRFPECNHFLINQVAWNAFVQTYPAITLFTTPEIIKSGYDHNLFWFIAEHIELLPLVSSENLHDDTLLRRFLPQIGEILSQIDSIQPLLLPKDLFDMKDYKYKAAMHEISLMTPHIREDIGKLVALFEDYHASLQFSLRHGDFIPTHMFPTHPKMTIIDGEFSMAMAPRFYDAAHFYHFLYVSMENKELAHTFLEEAVSTIVTEEDQRCFLTSLVMKCISGFWNQEKYKTTDISFHQQLKKDILAEKIFD